MRSSLGAAMSLRFRIIESLGSGGFGAVHEAVDTRTGERVALKLLDDRSAASIGRFKQEFRVLSDFHHPNLVGLKELIEEDDRWTLVMELVPGADFLTFVRGPADNDNQRYDEAKLRTALLGMARGLSALHGFGVVHRDLKPSNVRVTPEGRAVLLDFGLVTSVDPGQQSAHAGLLGTAPYMAPEQALKASIGPAADWYAYGVCLFEALTGTRPFEGETMFHILSEKSARPAPRASDVVSDVPPDLDVLCARLLERDPAQRAGAAEVFAVFGAERDVDRDDGGGPRGATRVPFAGREAELRQLERAFTRTEEGALRLVLVEGESGVGKSELVAEFLRRVRRREGELLTLAGRCYENEQLAYKAFDGCIDELARFLQRLPERLCAQLLPERATLLGQLFPMLRGVPAIAKASRSEPSAEPSARRLEAFSALAGLLGKLAQERPVVLVMDDLQWADAESFRLLLALLEHAEPLPLLVLATIRPPEELDADVRAGVEALRRTQRVESVSILGLPAQEAAELARRLLGPGTSDAYSRLIASESGGHPLFLAELVQFVRSHDLASRAGLSLESALRTRIERLGAPARELLEIAALAGRPHSRQRFAQALGVADVDEAARALLKARLLRVRKHQELGVYHDRIRHAAVALVAKSRLPTLHRRLATALSADPASDAFEQAQQWDLAGEPERAVEAYARAAEQAFEALAFIRAAELARRALELDDDAPADRAHGLLVLYANALACAGRSAEAATCFERAAGQASGRRRHELRARHAQQLILCGKLEEGIGTMRGLLRELGIRFPHGTLATLLQVVAYRILLAARGHTFTTRPPRPEDEHLTFTVEVLGTFSQALSPVHPLGMMLLMVRAARLALKIPLTRFVLELYSALGWMRALDGSRRAADAMFERAHRLAPAVDRDIARANALYVEGSARVVTAEMERAVKCLEEAHHILQTRCPDHPGQLRNVRYHLGLVWYALGAHQRVASETERWITEARERGDPLTVALITGLGHGFVRHLMRDDPEAALRELDGALRELPSEPFSFVHHGALVGRVTVLFYKGGRAAEAWLGEHVEGRPRPFLLRSQVARQTLRGFAATAALHALFAAEPRERAELARRARRLVRPLLRSDSGVARVHANLSSAQLAALDGERTKALSFARAARQASAGYPDAIASRIATYLEVLLETGTAEDARCQEIERKLGEQGWRNPRAYLRSMLPLLHQRRAQEPKPSREALLLDRYEVLRPLGGGGFGTVVEARDVQTGRTVALKELVSKQPRSLERFKQEFRELCDLHHPNLVRLEALLEQRGTFYIVMELLEGEPLIAYCRPNGALDRPRLVTAFSGVCAGLGALHEAGFAHRDVSSENVCVTGDGRAVLLDFGLIGRLSDAHDGGELGAIEYAAPEQLAGAPPAVASDVYALGTCLYQAISGVLPYVAATPAAALADKRERPVPPLRAPGAEDLAQLATEMLARDPAARPSLARVVALLRRGVAEEVVAAPPIPSPLPARGFAGREEELACLERALVEAEGGLRVVLIEGESGLGKSALAAELARRVVARRPAALVLKSRCYESEQIAFKAFDGAVDEIARALRALSPVACELLLPKRAALLAELFPVLGSVPSIADASKRGLPAAPAARERAALASFVELLVRLSADRVPLLWIDDLQWADAESLRLLGKLLEARAQLRLLVVCTQRPAHELPPDVRAPLATLAAAEGVEVIRLGGLSDAASRLLLTELAGGPPPRDRLARWLAEAKGHPLFLRELVEQERAGSAVPGGLTLDQALERRISAFDRTARRLLSLVALAQRPYGSQVFVRAMQSGSLRDAQVSLLARGLLRRVGSDALAVHHDKVARAALQLLQPAERRVLARALAEALAREPSAEPGERARLWDLSGDAAEASLAYAEAGDRALASLQFVGAAQHYARAIELLPREEDDRRRQLLARRGDALARAGRSAEAARAYQAAAEGIAGEPAVRLRVLAAEQAIQSADAEWGLAAARTLLAELGIPLPARSGAALLGAAWNRSVVALRGRRGRPRSHAPAPRTRMQLEAAWSLALPISWLDPLAGAALTARHVRIALASGEPAHTARALAADAFAQAVSRPSARKIDQLLARARELATVHGDPALSAEIDYREGLVATYRYEVQHSRERLERALACVTERCPDQPWLTTNIRMALGAVWFHAGAHARLADASTRWLAEARERGDQFALTILRGLGYGFVAALMADDPHVVLAEVEAERALWPAEPFSFVHFGELIATSYARNYAGDARGVAWFERELPRLRRASLLRIRTGRAILLALWSLTALHALCSERRGDERVLRGYAEEALAELRGVRTPFALHFAPFLEAQLEALEGAHERAVVRLERVEQAALASGFLEHAQRAQYLRAVLVGGEQGRTEKERLLAGYAEEGWKRPERAAALMCPAILRLD